MVSKSLHPRVKALSEERFESATTVQKKAFAPILAGKNTLVIAPTGIGKTEAALLPIFSLMLREREKKLGDATKSAAPPGAAKPAAPPKDKKATQLHRMPGISVLYITPLKALNRDLLGRIEWWAEHLDLDGRERPPDPDS